MKRPLRGQVIHRTMAGLQKHSPRGGRSILYKQSSTQGQTCFNYYWSVEKSFLSKCLALLLKQIVLCSYHYFCHYFLLTTDFHKEQRLETESGWTCRTCIADSQVAASNSKRMWNSAQRRSRQEADGPRALTPPRSTGTVCPGNVLWNTLN